MGLLQGSLNHNWAGWQDADWICLLRFPTLRGLRQCKCPGDTQKSFGDYLTVTVFTAKVPGRGTFAPLAAAKRGNRDGCRDHADRTYGLLPIVGSRLLEWYPRHLVRYLRTYEARRIPNPSPFDPPPGSSVSHVLMWVDAQYTVDGMATLWGYSLPNI